MSYNYNQKLPHIKVMMDRAVVVDQSAKYLPSTLELPGSNPVMGKIMYTELLFVN